MGSTTPPDTLKELRQPSQSSSDPTKCEQLERLLTIKEQEIRLLKSQLEKYKLALSQSQVQQQQQQQQQTPLASASTETRSASDNDENLLDFPQDEANFTANSTVETIISDVVEKLVADDEDETSDISPMEESFTKESPNHSKTPMRQAKTSCSSATFSSGKVVPKEGPDDDDDDDDDDDERDSDEKDKEKVDTHVALSSTKEVTAADSNQSSDDASDTIDDELYSVIQDVGEIDLNMELKREQRKRRKVRAVSLDSDKKSIDKDDAAQLRVKDLFEDGEDDHGPDDDEDIISDGLLTSLTDAAINNLSQLAALQERCESQDSSQSHHQYSEQTSGRPGASQTLDQQVTTSGLYTSRPSSIVATTPIVSSTSISSTGLGSIRRHSQQSDSSNRDLDSFNVQNPFSASNIANQAALAISAAAAALHHKPAPAPPSSSSILSQSQTSSISSNSNLQTDLSSGQSLASAVAAAAVAAAAANDQQQQQQHHHHHHPHPHPTQNQPHQLHSTSQSRLISSALSSPEFYQNLHQQHQRSQASQAASMQHQVSSLHSYSPASPINPSPLSLLAHSRRPASNTSSSFMSPISSPNYLRRQFMPDRLPIMSPSPSSMTSGTGSGASSSLAHILQQHHQQRSASAMACQITSQSSTPLSGTGSSVMSPMMGSQNSSQARLNNMQIRHKFGYLGSSRGQFNSPHGFCLGLNQEIVVADTNNHRICIFDKGGSYLTQFGSPGKEEGQLWNPRKVAILHRSVAGGVNQRQSATGSGSNQLAGEPLYVVCDRGAERSRMQLFTKDGLFIKKIGIHYIDIVAGLAITQNGLIIVVDSVSPTVYIINAETGTLNGWFDCSGHMKEPSDIAVKSEMPGNEYFICDFKGHCVVVFNEQGEYLRKIGHDGLTSYPNGIDISDDGDILVGDSHGNRFHVVVFDRNGNFVSQFECPHVKVSRCCGLKITREGYIVTLAKNNHHVLVLDTIHI